MRAALTDAAEARAQRAGVLIAAPLGLCFLPAFLVLGVAPVVIGLAGEVLVPMVTTPTGLDRSRRNHRPLHQEAHMSLSDPTAPRRSTCPRVRRRLRRLLRDDAGMSTVEYAIGCVAAAGFAALLYSVVTGDSVTAALTQLVQRALTAGF